MINVLVVEDSRVIRDYLVYILKPIRRSVLLAPPKAGKPRSSS